MLKQSVLTFWRLCDILYIDYDVEFLPCGLKRQEPGNHGFYILLPEETNCFLKKKKKIRHMKGNRIYEAFVQTENVFMV